jgi:hypothetical protein
VEQLWISGAGLLIKQPPGDGSFPQLFHVEQFELVDCKAGDDLEVIPLSHGIMSVLPVWNDNEYFIFHFISHSLLG